MKRDIHTPAAWSTPDDVGLEPRAPRRMALTLAALAAAIALTSGFVSEAKSTTYRWSIGEAPPAPGTRTTDLDSAVHMTQLLLSSHVPDQIDVKWSCGIGATWDDQTEHLLMGTSGLRNGGAGFEIRTVDHTLFHLLLAGNVFARVDAQQAMNDPDCTYNAVVGPDGAWNLRQGNVSVASGRIERPTVTAIATDVDEKNIPPRAWLTVDITTAPHGPSVSFARTILRLMSLGLLVLVVTAVLWKSRRASRREVMQVRAALPRRNAPAFADVLVALVLIAWWLIGPVLFDDGWVLSTVGNFASDGVYGSYYAPFNAPLPLGFLHDAILRSFWLASPSLLWLRIPALVAGAATWAFTRSIVRSGSLRFGVAGHGTEVAAASVFLLSWISWNSTLRPEPLIALLVATSTWAAVRFTQTEDPGLILLGSAVAAIAISMHPAGLVTLAAPLAALRSMVRWFKANPKVGSRWLALSALAGGAIFLLALLSMGDFRFWLSSVSGFGAEGEHSGTVFNEFQRYQDLLGVAETNSVRQLSVFLPLFAPVMFLLRRSRQHAPSSDLPVTGFVIALVLLAFAPSKWIWHFGVLTPLAAAAFGIEWHRWQSESKADSGKPIHKIFVLICCLFVTLAVWDGWFAWNRLAPAMLETNQGGARLERLLAFHPTVVVGSVIVLFLALRWMQFRQLEGRGAARPWLTDVSSSIVPASSLLAVTISLSIFAIDGFVLSPGWSLARQNVGQKACGIADDIFVPSDSQGPTESTSAAEGNLQFDQTLTELVEQRGGRVLMSPQIRMYFPCFDQPVIDEGVADLPSVVLAVAGWPTGLNQSPYFLLPEVATLRSISAVWPARNVDLPIDVILVEPRTESYVPLPPTAEPLQR